MLDERIIFYMCHWPLKKVPAIYILCCSNDVAATSITICHEEQNGLHSQEEKDPDLMKQAQMRPLRISVFFSLSFVNLAC